MNYLQPHTATRLERFDLLRFPLIVLVVYIHAGTAIVFTDESVNAGNALTAAIQYTISQLIGGAAVPLFFLISGYLLFRSFEPTLAGYLEKLRTRSHTLLVPYLFWNTALLALVALIVRVPQVAPFVLHGLPHTDNVWAFLGRVYGTGAYPFAFQFWFIRDLIIMVVAAPLVYVVTRWAGPFVLAVLGVLWAGNIWTYGPPACEAVLFFTLGAYLVQRRIDPFRLDQFWPAVAVLTPGLLLTALLANGSPYADITRHLAAAGVVVALLCLSGVAVRMPGLRTLLLALAPASFLLFALHEPLQSILNKLIYRFMPVSSLGALALYLLLPLLLSALLVALHAALRRLTPRFLSLITGRT